MNPAWVSGPAWLLASGDLARVRDARVPGWEGPWEFITNWVKVSKGLVERAHQTPGHCDFRHPCLITQKGIAA